MYIQSDDSHSWMAERIIYLLLPALMAEMSSNDKEKAKWIKWITKKVFYIL